MNYATGTKPVFKSFVQSLKKKHKHNLEFFSNELLVFFVCTVIVVWANLSWQFLVTCPIEWLTSGVLIRSAGWIFSFVKKERSGCWERSGIVFFCSNGTSMISLIIPPRDQIARISKMLADEYGTASNIKSRVNRLSVLGAITSVQGRLKLYNKGERLQKCL